MSLCGAFKLIFNYITGIAMSNNTPILVTGAAGNVGSIWRGVVKLLGERDPQVRALVRRLDERSQVLSEMGAELVVATYGITRRSISRP
jgi:NADPH:quinone reductase-like Zn-dependent oxidoreductase